MGTPGIAALAIGPGCAERRGFHPMTRGHSGEPPFGRCLSAMSARSRSIIETTVIATKIHPIPWSRASDGHDQPRRFRTMGVPASTK